MSLSARNNLIQAAIVIVLALSVRLAPAADRVCENVSNVIGLATINFDSTTVLPLFAQPSSTEQPVEVLRFYYDPATKSDTFRAEKSGIYPLLRPEMHKLSYSLFELPVRSKRSGWLEVVVDERKAETLWVNESETVRFLDWLSKMRSSFAVEPRNPKANPLLARPAEGAREVKVKGRGCFTVERMQGDWIKVIRQHDCDGVPIQSVSGWVKWRDGRGCLLVSIYPFA
jgi:hypothetical protein